MPSWRANYTWGLYEEFIWIVDEGEDCISLTNDLPNCLLEISGMLPTRKVLTDYFIIYSDSEKNWDAARIIILENDLQADQEELSLRNKLGRPTFATSKIQLAFQPIGTTDYEKARYIVLTDPDKFRHQTANAA